MKKLYEYMFYCFYISMGKDDTIYFRVCGLLSAATSFIALGLIILIRELIRDVGNASDLQLFIMVMSLFMGNMILHFIYFLKGSYYEVFIDRYNPSIYGVQFFSIFKK